MVMAWWNLIALMITNQVVLLSAERCFNLGNLGYVTPENDTYLTAGTPLHINCTLDNVTESSNAHNIEWSLTGESHKSLNPSATWTVINNATSQLTILNTTTHDSGHYSCKLKAGTLVSKICGVQFTVGYAPPENTKIICEAQGWKKMNCTWKQPENPISITWKFHYIRNRRRHECTNYFDKSQQCIIDITFPSIPCFRIYLKGSNELGVKTTVWNFLTDQHVILRQPTFHVNNTTEKDATLGWSVESKPTLNLQCEIHYYCTWPVDLCNRKMVSFNVSATKELECRPTCEKECTQSDATDKIEHSYKLNNLLPHTNYTAFLRCQLSLTVFPDKWSKTANVTFQTKSAVPIMKPEIVVEDVKKVTSDDSVNLIVYWKEIPQYFHNGSEFYYKVTNGSDFWISPKSGIILKDISLDYEHNLHVHLCNEKGCALSSTTVVIPKSIMVSKLIQVYAVQFYPDNIYEVTWRLNSSKITEDQFVIVKCMERNTDSLPKTVAGKPCNTTSQVIRASVTSTRILSTSTSAYTVYSTNFTSNLPDSGYKYKFAVAIRNSTFSSGLASASCITENGHQRKVKLDPIKEGMTWAEIKWEVPNGCLTKNSQGYEISYWTSDKKKTYKSISLDDPFATMVNLTELNPKTNYEGRLIAKSVITSAESYLSFTFETKDGPVNSQIVVVFGSVIGGIVFVAVIVFVMCYLGRKVKSKVKELKNIQIPSGLRDDSSTFQRPSFLSQEPTDLALTKLDSPLLIPSLPPAPEKINGSHSSGFGSDFQSSTTSSPTTSFSSSNHASHECNMDPDTPSVIAGDSVFEYSFDPVQSYSLLGKSAPSDVQCLNPSALDEFYLNPASVDLSSYAKVAVAPVGSKENDDDDKTTNVPVQTNSVALMPADEPYSFSKGYTSLAAAELTMQPYVKVALDSVREKEANAGNSMAYVSVGMSNDSNCLDERPVAAAEDSGLGYVSSSFLTDQPCSSTGIPTEAAMYDEVYVDDDDDDDSIISFDDSPLKTMDDDDAID